MIHAFIIITTMLALLTSRAPRLSAGTMASLQRFRIYNAVSHNKAIHEWPNQVRPLIQQN